MSLSVGSRLVASWLHTRSAGTVTTGTSRPGGRTARTRDAVFEATLAELGAVGYGHTSVEAIAQRAGVHKTTIYRRWGTKDRLVADTLAHVALVRTEVADTGDIDADMRALARAVVVTLTSPEGLATVRASCRSRPARQNCGRC